MKQRLLIFSITLILAVQSHAHSAHPTGTRIRNSAVIVRDGKIFNATKLNDAEFFAVMFGPEPVIVNGQMLMTKKTVVLPADAMGSRPLAISREAAILFAVACLAADDSLPSLSDAKQRFEHGDFAGAERVYSALASRQPDNIVVLSNLGVVRFRLGKLKPAEEAIRQALRVAPKDQFCHRTLAIILQQQGRDAEAMIHFKEAGEAPPKQEATPRPSPELMPIPLASITSVLNSAMTPNHAMQLTGSARHGLCYRPADLTAQAAPHSACS